MSDTQTQPTTREQWLEERKKSIGASQVASVLGLNPWETPLQLFMRVQGKLDWPDETEAMEIGQAVESAIDVLYQKRTGRVTQDLGRFTLQRRDEFPHQHATLDRLIHPCDGHDMGGCGEYKHRSERYLKEFEENGPPIADLAQVHAQMMCSGCAWGSLATLFGNRALRYWDTPRDPDVVDWIATGVADFWERLQKDEPPEAVAADNAILHKLWPRHVPNRIIELPVAFGAFVDARIKAKGAIQVAEADLAEIDTRIKAEMGDAEQAIIPGRQDSFTWRTSDRKEYTSHHPACTIRTLRYKKPRKGK